eukprot:s1818_g22.t2
MAFFSAARRGAWGRRRRRGGDPVPSASAFRGHAVAVRLHGGSSDAMLQRHLGWAQALKRSATRQMRGDPSIAKEMGDNIPFSVFWYGQEAMITDFPVLSEIHAALPDRQDVRDCFQLPGPKSFAWCFHVWYDAVSKAWKIEEASKTTMPRLRCAEHVQRFSAGLLDVLEGFATTLFVDSRGWRVEGLLQKLVVGCHMVGAEAGEMMQGIGIAMKAGAKKADFDATVGIHPTAAEEWCTMRTKTRPGTTTKDGSLVSLGFWDVRENALRFNQCPGTILPGSSVPKKRGSMAEPVLLRSLQGPPEVRLTACSLLPGRQQIATGSQDGTLLLWNLSPGRPRPVRLGSSGRGQVTCIKALGQTLVSSSMDSTVSIWKSWEKSKAKPATMKLHFSPVRCVDLSWDEQLLLTASDDKTLKLSALSTKRFVASYLGHSNWIRAASLSSSASRIVSGGDDKTVRLWDVEKKSCLQTFYDSASSITCTKFGLDDSIIVASSWDSSINIWDVRSFQLRQHYGRAHGSSPVTQVALHPRGDLILSCAADRQLRLWDLRAGKLRNSILGHDRPIHSCSWDESGEHFLSCDSELVFYWSLRTAEVESPTTPDANPPVATDAALDAFDAAETVRPKDLEPARDQETPSAVPRDPRDPGAGPDACDETPEKTLQKPGSLQKLLEAAWAGEEVLQSKVADLQEQNLPEAAALMLEKMVTEMDVLTHLLESIEQRLAQSEASTAELQQLLAARRPLSAAAEGA